LAKSREGEKICMMRNDPEDTPSEVWRCKSKCY
jgi:hypothetical protein